jgi:hypothetical protein
MLLTTAEAVTAVPVAEAGPEPVDVKLVSIMTE